MSDNKRNNSELDKKLKFIQGVYLLNHISETRSA